MAQPGRPQMATRRMRIAGLAPKATETYSEYVILITLSLQQWIHELATLVRCTYSSVVQCCLLRQSGEHLGTARTQSQQWTRVRSPACLNALSSEWEIFKIGAVTSGQSIELHLSPLAGRQGCPKHRTYHISAQQCFLIMQIVIILQASVPELRLPFCGTRKSDSRSDGQEISFLLSC